MARKSRHQKSKNKNPKTKFNPPSIKKPAEEAFHIEGYIIWSFSLFDGDFHLGSKESQKTPFKEVASRIKECESRSWKEIDTDHKRDHPILAGKLVKEARDRLLEKKIDDDSLFRFRFTGKQRLWGVRRGDKFYVLWWDPEHLVYPVEKKYS